MKEKVIDIIANAISQYSEIKGSDAESLAEHIYIDLADESIISQ